MTSGLISQIDRRRFEAFVEDYRKSPYGFNEAGEPIAIIPSPIDEELLIDHENVLGATLPPLFRAYLLTSCLPTTDLYVGQLPPIKPDRPFEWVERWSVEKMEEPFYRRNRRLLPFTHGVADMSEMCFDIYSPDARGDYPIIDIRYKQQLAVPGPWSDLDCGRSQVFPSFSAYLDYLHEWLIYRTAPPESLFEDWLRTRGKQGPSRSCGDPDDR